MGRGTLLAGRPMGGQPQPGSEAVLVATDDGIQRLASAPLLVVAASDVEIAGLHVDRVFATGIAVGGGAALPTEHVIVRDNVFTGLGRNVPATGIALTAGAGRDAARLADIWVRDNRLEDVQVPIPVVGGAASRGGAHAAVNAAEDVHVVGNTAERGTSGVFACAGSAVAGGVAEQNVVRDLEVARNRIVENRDVALGISSSCLLDGGAGSGNRLDGIRFRDNEVFTPQGSGRRNSALFVSGAELFLGAGDRSAGDHVDGVDIERNLLDGVTSGAFVVAGYLERCGDGCNVTGSIVENERFHGNTWRNLEAGLTMVGSAAAETAGLVEGSTLRAVDLTGERIAARTTGLVVQGGLVASIDLCTPVFAGCVQFPGYRQPATVRDSEVGSFTLSDSTITANQAVTLGGGVSSATEDTVTGVTLHDVTLDGNTIAGGSVGVIGGVVVTSGTVAESAVRDVLLHDNRTPAGGSVAVVQPDELAVGAAAASVHDNVVMGVSVQ